MTVETVIYSYLAICGAVIIFNIASVFVLRGKERGLHLRTAFMKELIENCIADIDSGGEPDESHLSFLEKKLRHISYLTAFDEALKELKKENEQAAVQIAAQRQEILRLYPLKEELRKVKNELNSLKMRFQYIC